VFQISSKQAQEIALLIYSDIQSYVNTHRAEYKLFLANGQNRKNGSTKKVRIRNGKCS